MADETGSEDVEAEDVPERPGWSRVVIMGAAALAVLLVGATVGLLVSRSTQDEQAAPPGAGSVEVGFAQDMSIHHLQAVTMANWARDHSTDREVKQLAFDIASTQLEQIGRMKGWLMLWEQPEQPLGKPMTWMSGHGDSGGHGGGHAAAAAQPAGEPLMPGMATNEELAGMRALSGKELDVSFLQLMLRHHQGGTDMAQYAFDHSQLPAVRALTTSMLKSQGAEMELMRRLLAERGAEPLPFP